jgi:ATP-binding cassette, subfamily B, bacterial
MPLKLPIPTPPPAAKKPRPVPPPPPRRHRMLAAARAADAHGFISALPDGYDTMVGQRGRLLSGGQRQRISIARAFLRDAPVLILDEPTTGLDTASADRLLTVIHRFAVGHTAIVITHDPRVTAAADDVLRLPVPAALSYGGQLPR